MTRAIVVLAGVCLALPGFARQQPRDPRSPAGGLQQRPPAAPEPPIDPRHADPGAAAITGIVFSDERPPRPLRRVRVALNSAELAVGRTVIANDDGSFAFERLSPGRYTLTAAKDGYVPLNYGAKRPLRPGLPIIVRRGERRQLGLALTRGSVITGTIAHPDGQPATSINVSAVLYRYGMGAQRPVPTGVATAVTDDRGVYRIFGLAAGDYIVAAELAGRESNDGELQVISETEIRRALAEVRDPFARPQSAAPARSTATQPGRSEPARAVRFATVYSPGTAVASKASFVTLDPAEERRGVDFELGRVPAATLSGTLLTSSGVGPAQIVLAPRGGGPAALLPRSTLAGPEGQFTFANVDPGEYTLMSNLPRPAVAFGGLPPAGEILWASADVFVDGEDVVNVALAPHPGVSIRGRVVFEGAAPPPRLGALRVALPAMILSGDVTVPPLAVRLEADGRFTADRIIPGAYRLRTVIQGQRAPVGPWWLKSVVIGGREILDTPLELPQNSGDAIVTFSDRATELRGTLSDGRGQPVPGAFVVAFSVEPESWFFNSRRVAAGSADARGRYSLRNLPPGDYFLAPCDDLDPDEWYDPMVLERLTRGARRLRLADGETQTHNVVVASGQRP